jgi:hypothetical protein
MSRSIACIGIVILLSGAGWACNRQPAPEANGASAGTPGNAVVPNAPPKATDPAAVNEAVRQARELVANMEGGAGAQAVDPAGPRKGATRLLGGFTEADVIRAAGGAADPRLRWRIAEWTARKNTLVALSFVPAHFGDPPEVLRPQLFVLERRAEELGLLAKAKLDLGKVACRNDSGEPAGGEDRAPELQLDLAPYGITADRTAIGVRFTCFNTFPAGEGSETRLLLIDVRPPALRQIFDAQVAHTNFDRPTGNETTSAAVLSVQREQHEGYFDLSVRTTTETVGSDPESFPNTAQRAMQRTELVRFVWRGDRYVVVDPR